MDNLQMGYAKGVPAASVSPAALSAEIFALHARAVAAEARAAAVERLRPVWDFGGDTVEQAAQRLAEEVAVLWAVLGVNSPASATMRIATLFAIASAARALLPTLQEREAPSAHEVDALSAAFTQLDGSAG